MEPHDYVALGLESLLAYPAASFPNWSTPVPAAPAQGLEEEELFQQQETSAPPAEAFGVSSKDALVAHLLPADLVTAALGAVGSSLPPPPQQQQQQQPFMPDLPVSDPVLEVVAEMTQLFEQQMAVLRGREQQLAVNTAPAGQQQQGKHPAVIPSTEFSWTHLLLPVMPDLAASGDSSREFQQCGARLSVPGSEPTPTTPDKETEHQQAESSLQLFPGLDTWPDTSDTWPNTWQVEQTCRAPGARLAGWLGIQTDDPVEAPAEAPAEVSDEAPAQAPAEVSDEAPAQAPAQAPAETRAEVPVAAPASPGAGGVTGSSDAESGGSTAVAHADDAPLVRSNGNYNRHEGHRVTRRDAIEELKDATFDVRLAEWRLARLQDPEQGACPEALAEAVSQLELARAQHKQAQQAFEQFKRKKKSQGGSKPQPQHATAEDGLVTAEPTAVQEAAAAEPTAVQEAGPAQPAVQEQEQEQEQEEERHQPQDSTDEEATTAAGAQAVALAGVAPSGAVGAAAAAPTLDTVAAPEAATAAVGPNPGTPAPSSPPPASPWSSRELGAQAAGASPAVVPSVADAIKALREPYRPLVQPGNSSEKHDGSFAARVNNAECLLHRAETALQQASTLLAARLQACASAEDVEGTEALVALMQELVVRRQQKREAVRLEQAAAEQQRREAAEAGVVQEELASPGQRLEAVARSAAAAGVLVQEQEQEEEVQQPQDRTDGKSSTAAGVGPKVIARDLILAAWMCGVIMYWVVDWLRRL